MSAEGLKKAVLERARAEADEILSRARGEVETTIAAARERAERSAKEAVEKAERESGEARSRAVSSVEREIHMKALEGKNRLLDEAFSRAAGGFAGLPFEEIRELYRKELEGLDLQGATVCVPPGAKKEFKSLLGGAARIEEDASLEAGYMILHEDFRLDRSIEARLEELKRQMRSELAQMLFAEET